MPPKSNASPIARAVTTLSCAAGASLAGLAPAAAQTPAAQAAPTDSWQSCAATQEPAARLACFDTWALRQQATPAVVAAPGITPPPAPGAAAPAAAPIPPAEPAVVASAQAGCRDDRYSRLSRFWELERATDCGTFELRGYRPISASVVAADSVNRRPTSPAPGRSDDAEEPYRTAEARIQLSARVKIAANLLTARDPVRSDSLWVGFTQQSYWQFFTPELSRPFRTTDYEPEAVYVYPAALQLPLGWRFSHVGLGVSHQSNGRQLPQSRSWNRVYAMAGFELDNRFGLEARVWKRAFENGNDDNPDISNFMGRSELTGFWHMSPLDTVATTVRHNLRSSGKGSLRLEYFRALGKGGQGGPLGDLRFHAQYFSGYGDSMLDYNRKRNVLSLGVALVDW
ncbi:phospholipase A [Ramlibacter tataouinensis]|nr:phospholipase A [Ramlibacter tataouinensis]